MGPTRTGKDRRLQSGHGSAEGSVPSKRNIQGETPYRRGQPSDTSFPGVQKLKSSLRQTRRLLAKDNLAADVRVETERRFKALEAELSRAEIAKKERTMAVRYHKVKFFERQKVLRKLKQTKRKLSEAHGSSRKKLEDELLGLRVDLNYILHYPKTMKYISLFPRHMGEGDLTSVHAEFSKTEERRQKVRLWIQTEMEGGRLPSEPELHSDHFDSEKLAFTASTTWDRDGSQSEQNANRQRSSPKKDTLGDDGFFEDDGSDDDSQEASRRDSEATVSGMEDEDDDRGR